MLQRLQSIYSRQHFATTCVRAPEESPVLEGLSLTPAQMSAMTAEGIPVSNQALGMTYCDGQPNPTFDLPPEDLRGCDIVDTWEAHKAAKSKFKDIQFQRKEATK